MHRSRQIAAVKAMLISLLGGFVLLWCGVANAVPTSGRQCVQLGRQVIPGATAFRAYVVKAGAYRLPAPALPPGATPPPGYNPYPSGMNLAGQASPAANPEFCRLEFTLKPSADSRIRTEVWLPMKGWNGKVLGVGNFGWGGDLQYPNMLAGLSQGYAVATNDAGHDNGIAGEANGEFLLGHPQKLLDYGGRANHLMTLRAKVLVRGFYGRGASKAYFVGCSLGGLQALIEAQRYPTDYDAIVAGAPPNPLAGFNAAQLWPGWLLTQDPRGSISRDQLNMVKAAVIRACASPIGQQQGFVDLPERCRFDPSALTCTGSQDASTCLTEPQVKLLQAIYQGPRNPRSGSVIFPGPAPGAEDQLGIFVSGKVFTNALDFFRYAAFQDAGWTPDRLDWSRDVEAADARTGRMFTVSPDLGPFLKRGGKLLLYVGWGDFHNPNELADYYRLLRRNNGRAADAGVRLFTMPGVNHCGGGQGCDTFSKLAVIDDWARTGAAPVRIATMRVEGGKIVRTRPICAYPLVARYKGAGDTADQRSFDCVDAGSKR